MKTPKIKVSKSYKGKNIQEEIEKDAEKFFKKMDKMMEKDWGTMCPDFEPDCIQCRIHLYYNQFKSNVWEDFVRRK